MTWILPWLVVCILYLYNSSFMHDDTVIWILGELMECTCGGTMDDRVRGLEVLHQGSHS